MIWSGSGLKNTEATAVNPTEDLLLISESTQSRDRNTNDDMRKHSRVIPRDADNQKQFPLQPRLRNIHLWWVGKRPLNIWSCFEDPYMAPSIVECALLIFWALAFKDHFPIPWVLQKGGCKGNSASLPVSLEITLRNAAFQEIKQLQTQLIFEVFTVYMHNHIYTLPFLGHPMLWLINKSVVFYLLPEQPTLQLSPLSFRQVWRFPFLSLFKVLRKIKPY